MSAEQVAALIAIGSYFALKTIDRFFRVVDHWLDHKLDEEESDHEQ